MRTQPITMDIKEPIQRLRAGSGHASASHSFPSLFLWQQDMDLSVCLREGAFAVRHGGEKNTWFFPCGQPRAVRELVEEILAQGPGARLLYLRRQDAEFLETAFPGRFRVTEAPDASEYLFDREEYTRLPGKAHAKIRWSVNRLQSHHDLRLEPLGEDTLRDVAAILEQWTPRTDARGPFTDHETAPLLLDHYAQLDVTGAVVYLDGRPAAVAAGFPLSGESFDLAFAKAAQRETGLLHFTRRAFVETLPPQYTIINGEEDLGIPGLRKLKQLERPVGQIVMYEAYAQG